jgi:hypothetical protein
MIDICLAPPHIYNTSGRPPRCSALKPLHLFSRWTASNTSVPNRGKISDASLRSTIEIGPRRSFGRSVGCLNMMAPGSRAGCRRG